MTTPLLELRDLSLSAGPRRVVEGLGFDIAAGEVLGLVGESGSGKSLTALALLGLLPDGIRIAGGSARFAGQALLTLDERGWRRLRGCRIAMVFQDPMASLNPFMSAGAQVSEALRQHHSLSRTALLARRNALFAEVGLDAALHAGRAPHALSGGQQQRVVIAMALAGDPALLLADEPTTALDVAVQAQILALLRRLAADRGLAMLFISHDLAVVASIADRVGVMRHGRLLELGSKRDVLTAPAHAYTRSLVAARQALAGSATMLPDATPEPALRVTDLAVDYPGQGLWGRPRRVVEGVTLAIPRGGVLSLIGASGSGKSSVARALVGLAEVAKGQVEVCGAPLPPGLVGRRHPLARRIQIVFQNPYGSLNPRMTIAQALAEPLRAQGTPAPEWRGHCVAALEEVGLGVEHLSRYPAALSGGQRQRIAIARALLAGPDVLVCDEVLSALDAAVQAQVLSLLKSLRRSRRLALLFIGHDLDVVRHLGGNVAVMAGGRIVEQGPVAKVLSQPRHAGTRLLADAQLRLAVPADYSVVA